MTIIDKPIFWKVILVCFAIIIAVRMGINADNILRLAGAPNRFDLIAAKYSDIERLITEQGENRNQIELLQTEIVTAEEACERVNLNQGTAEDITFCDTYTNLGGREHYEDRIRESQWRIEDIEFEKKRLYNEIGIIERATWWDLLFETEKYE